MEYIKTSLDEDGSGLISSHYIEEVLPQTKQFKEFHCNRLTDWVDGVGQRPLKDVFAESRELNERQTEDVLIRPILESLDNKLLAQVGLDGDIMDFVVYDGDECLPIMPTRRPLSSPSDMDASRANTSFARKTTQTRSTRRSIICARST